MPGTDRKTGLHARPRGHGSAPLHFDPIAWRARLRAINPLIAAAVSFGSGEFPARTPVRHSGKPNEALKFKTPVLIHRSDTTPRGNPIPAAVFSVFENARKEQRKTSALVPGWDFVGWKVRGAATRFRHHGTEWSWLRVETHVCWHHR
jgi:hypothetical protein